jgi:ATP-dependent Clp protease ATP-binding subunit ClpA
VIGLDDHGYFTNIEKPSERFSTANVVFIFISDIGSEIMKDLLLQYNDRVKIPRMILRSNLKKILDKYWDHLKFGKIIHEVVPFLPLEEPHIRSIMESKLNILSSERSGIAWKELIVEESVINYLSGPNFITYENISKTFLMKGNSLLRLIVMT